jgi:hypothetical protein
MIKSEGLFITKFGATKQNLLHFKAEEITKMEKLNLSVDQFIYAANAIRDWADYVMVENDPDCLKTKFVKLSLTFDEKTKSIVNVEKTILEDM